MPQYTITLQNGEQFDTPDMASADQAQAWASRHGILNIAGIREQVRARSSVGAGMNVGAAPHALQDPLRPTQIVESTAPNPLASHSFEVADALHRLARSKLVAQPVMTLAQGLLLGWLFITGVVLVGWLLVILGVFVLGALAR